MSNISIILQEMHEMKQKIMKMASRTGLQTIMTHTKRANNYLAVDDRPLLASWWKTATGQSQHWVQSTFHSTEHLYERTVCHLSLIDGKIWCGGQWVKVPAFRCWARAPLCPLEQQLSQSAHTSTAAQRNGKMSTPFVDMQDLKAKLWLN